MSYILLTGSSGLLGSSIVRYLEKKNIKIATISNNKTNKKSHYVNFSSEKSISKFIDRYGVPKLFIHSGWGKMSEPNSEYHINENVQNSKKLLNTFVKKGLKKFLFIGTINEYGKKKGSVKETDKSNSKLRNYEKGKIKFAKYAIQLSKNNNFTYIHIRLANLFGPFQKKGSLIDCIHDAYKNKKILKVSSLDFYRDYLYSDEAALGIYKIYLKAKKSLIINLGSGSYIYMRDFVILYWKIIGGDKNKLIMENVAKSSISKKERYNLNIKLLKRITKWKPKNSIVNSIKKNIEYENV